MLNPTIFREYDIRGVADTELTSPEVVQLGRGLGTLLRRKAGPRINLGRDCRLSSPRLHDALLEGLIASGCEVTDIGVGPTPLLYFSAVHLKADGAVMITGSHNPSEFNGFKTVCGAGTIHGDGIQEVRRIIESGTLARGTGTCRAIDVSEASLRYARPRCATLNIRNVRFLNLDLHNISDLNEQFDAIWCTGVLHHLPIPERGWAALVAVLRPGGVMKIMVYSRIARLWVAAARTPIRDLMVEPINDDLLRRVRQRLMDRCTSRIAQTIINSSGFATLAGVHDLLIHRHEDPFDISRISRALECLRLRLLAFLLPAPDISARYNAMFPHDPRHQDIKSWARFERSEIGGNYAFWCCTKPSMFI